MAHARRPTVASLGSSPGQIPRAPAIRFRVDPAYAPAEKIARRLCLTEPQFDACRVRLFARGFPQPDETTGMYDLEAVDRWRKRQRPDLYPELTLASVGNEKESLRKSMGERFVEAKERRGYG